jgi:hypothetical protein
VGRGFWTGAASSFGASAGFYGAARRRAAGFESRIAVQGDGACAPRPAASSTAHAGAVRASKKRPWVPHAPYSHASIGDEARSTAQG